MISRRSSFAAIITLVAFLAPAAHADLAPFQESLLGNGTAGPYQLSWQQIPGQLLTVSKGGQNLVLGLDYNVDAGGGTITFTQALPADATAFVHYQYDTVTSVRVQRPISLPLSYNLEANQQTDLFMTGALQNTGETTGNGLAHLNLGVKSALQAANGTTFKAQMLYSAVSPGQAPTGAADRSGASVDAQTNAGKNVKLTMNWSRAGDQFDSAGTSGLATGASHFQVGANGTISKQMSASMTQSQDETNGVSHTTNNLSVTAAPDPKLKLNATVNTVDETNRTSSLNAQAGVTKTVSLSASVSQAQAGGDHSNQQQVGVNLTPSDKVQVSTNLTTKKNADVTSQATAVNATVLPVKVVRVEAGYVDRSTSPNDTDFHNSLDTTTAKVTVSPVKALSVVGQYGQNTADGSGMPQPVVLRGLGLQSTLGSFTLQGGYNWSQATDTSLISTQLSLGVGMKLASLAVNANYTGCVASASTPTEQTTQTYTLSVSHSLSDRLSLSVNGSVSQAVQGTGVTASNVTTTANLGMKF